MNLFQKAAFILFIFFIVACERNPDNVIRVDFSDPLENDYLLKAPDSVVPLRVAVAAMISPATTFSLYENLFSYISEKINKPLLFEQRKKYSEVNDLIMKDKVDVAFICSGAYQKIKNNCDLLVVPVCGGLPYYQAYIIVNIHSPYKTLGDLKGKSFAFTDELSLSGHRFAEECLNKFFNLPSESFFSNIVYTHAHDISIQMVSKNMVDGATVDHLIYNYLEKNNPQMTKNIRIIEKSPYFGIPPIVVPKEIDPQLKNRLVDIFTNLDNEPESKDILDKLLIEKFIVVGDTLYKNITF